MVRNMGTIHSLAEYREVRNNFITSNQERMVWECECGSRIYNIVHVKEGSGCVRCTLCNLTFSNLVITIVE